MPNQPAPLNPFDISNTAYNIAGNQFAGAGGIGLMNANSAGSILNGNLDIQAFLQAHPEFQEGYNDPANASNPNWIHQAISNASYITPQELARFQTGGVTGNLGNAAGQLQTSQNDLNQAATAGAINNAANNGLAATNATLAANPALAATNAAITGSVGNLNLSPASARPVVAQTIAPSASAGLQSVGMGNPFAGAVAPTYNPNVSNLSSPFLQTSDRFNNASLSPIQAALQQQALGDLALGGQLGAGEIRMAQQATRAADSARGLAMGPNSAANEILNQDYLQRQRLNERRAFAQGVDQQAFAQTNANNQIGLGYAGLANSANTSAGQLGLGYGQLNENARQYQGNMALNYDQLAQQNNQFNASLGQNNNQFNANLGQQGNIFNATAGNNMGQFNASREDAQLAANRNYALSANAQAMAQAQQNYQNYFQPSNGLAQAGAALGVANGYIPNYSMFYGAANNTANNAYDTNFNAAWNAYNASQNRNSGLLGAGLGAIGSIFGGPLGGMAGNALGNIFGGGVSGNGYSPAGPGGYGFKFGG